MKPVRVVMALAITAAAVRLVPLQWLHPLNWDEVEFYRATKWVAEGRVPFRDFWEHHTPLQWFVFAPFAALTSSARAASVIAMRWAQLPLWIATFWLMNSWMRRAELEAFARWTAMAIALASSLFMLSAVEFRPDVLACFLYVAGLVLAQRERPFLASFVFCLSAFANLRMGPLLVVTVLILLWRKRAIGLVFGGFAALALCLAYFFATGTVDDLFHGVVTQNYLADKHSPDSGPLFLHRILSPFGIRILGSPRLFDPAGVDPGGIAIIVLTLIGFVLAMRARGDLRIIAILAAANVLFVGTMKYVFIYHLTMAIVLALPLIAIAVARMPWRIAIAIAGAAWCVNIFASLLRGKELDLAYQDTIIREVHARSSPDETVWSGGPWAIGREPAYRIWFLHEIARALLRLGKIEPYRMQEPPALILFEHNAYSWLTQAQPELAPYFVRHYTPVWRNLWVPGMNARVAGGGTQEWVVPRDGIYWLYASEGLAGHPWFRQPLAISAFEQRMPLQVQLPPAAAHPALQWSMGNFSSCVSLQKGQRISVVNRGSTPLAVFLLSNVDDVIFRQPPPGVTLEASSPRVTHWPRIR
jgi:hypothetical protein